jgi:hypothetical protein
MAAALTPHHVNAMRVAAASYEFYILERHVLKKEKGQSHLTVEKLTGKREVGW